MQPSDHHSALGIPMPAVADPAAMRDGILMYGIHHEMSWFTASVLENIGPAASKHYSPHRDEWMRGLGTLHHHRVVGNYSLGLSGKPRKPSIYRPATRDVVMRRITRDNGSLIRLDDNCVEARCKNNHVCKIRPGDITLWCAICSTIKAAEGMYGDDYTCHSTEYTSSTMIFTFTCPSGHRFTAMRYDIEHGGTKCPSCLMGEDASDGYRIEVLPAASEYNHAKSPVRTYCHGCHLTFYTTRENLMESSYDCGTGHRDTTGQERQILEMIFRKRFDDSAIADGIYFDALSYEFGLALINQCGLANEYLDCARGWAKAARIRLIVINSNGYGNILRDIVTGLIQQNFMILDDSQKRIFIHELSCLQKRLVMAHRPLVCAKLR